MPFDASATSCIAPPTVDALRHVLGNTCRLAQSTLSCRWNVAGPAFFVWHGIFERQCTEMWEALGPLGERLRVLGAIALADHTDRLIVPVFDTHEPVPLTRMVSLLAAGHDGMVGAIGGAIDVARSVEDEATLRLLGERLLVHERYRWQLRTSLIG